LRDPRRGRGCPVKAERRQRSGTRRSRVGIGEGLQRRSRAATPLLPSGSPAQCSEVSRKARPERCARPRTRTLGWGGRKPPRSLAPLDVASMRRPARQGYRALDVQKVERRSRPPCFHSQSGQPARCMLRSVPHGRCHLLLGLWRSSNVSQSPGRGVDVFRLRSSPSVLESSPALDIPQAASTDPSSFPASCPLLRSGS